MVFVIEFWAQEEEEERNRVWQRRVSYLFFFRS